MTDSAASFVADTVKQSTSQFFGALSQTTKFSTQIATAFIDSFKSLANMKPSLPVLPFAPSKSNVKDWLVMGYETTEQLLKLQHELVNELLERLAVAAAA